MQYNHDTFTKALRSQRANFPHLKYEEASELIHLILKRKREDQGLTRPEKIIEKCLKERQVVKELERPYRSFAYSYMGIMGQIIKSGRAFHTQKPGPKQQKLPLQKPPLL